MENMTDKQLEVILNLVADKFQSCKNMEEVAKAIEDVRNMAKKEKPAEQQVRANRGAAGLPPKPQLFYEDFNKGNIESQRVTLPFISRLPEV